MRRALLLAVVLVAGCGTGGDDDGGGSSAGADVQLQASDFKFDRSDVTVGAAGETTFTLTNDGQTEHALEIEGNGVEEETDTVSPGESASVTVDLKPGEYEFYCPVDNHREMGMEGKLVVGGGSSGAGTSTGKTETDEGYGYGG